MARRILLLHCPGDKVYLHDYYTSYSSKANYYWPPSDLIMLSGWLRDFELQVLDAIAAKISEEESLRRIAAFAPEAIIFTTGTATWEHDRLFLEKVRAALPARLIGSGSVFLFEARRFFEMAPWLDAAILDLASPEVVDLVQGVDRDYTAMARRTVSGLSLPPAGPRPVQGFSIPVPRHELFPHDRNRSPLARRRPMALVVTSLGCPYTCRFCVAGSIPYRSRSVDNVIDELRFLKRLGIREIMFNDPTFTVSSRRVIELCRKMTEARLDFSWYANGHAASLDEDMISAMAGAGCHSLMIGVESGNDALLERYAKGVTRRKIRAAFDLCRRHRVRSLAYFIIGLPGETRETALETIRFAKELDPDFASFTIPTPDVGSVLRREAVEAGWLPEGLLAFDSTEFPVFAGGSLTREEIWALRQRAVRSFYLRPRYLGKLLRSVRRPRDLWFLVDQALSMFFR